MGEARNWKFKKDDMPLITPNGDNEFNLSEFNQKKMREKALEKHLVLDSRRIDGSAKDEKTWLTEVKMKQKNDRSITVIHLLKGIAFFIDAAGVSALGFFLKNYYHSKVVNIAEKYWAHLHEDIVQKFMEKSLPLKHFYPQIESKLISYISDGPFKYYLNYLSYLPYVVASYFAYHLITFIIFRRSIGGICTQLKLRTHSDRPLSLAQFILREYFFLLSLTVPFFWPWLLFRMVLPGPLPHESLSQTKQV